MENLMKLLVFKCLQWYIWHVLVINILVKSRKKWQEKSMTRILIYYMIKW